MLIADILLIIVSLIALIFSSITDLRTKEVPDWLSHGLISAALAIRLLHAVIFQEPSYFIFGLLGFIIMFIIGNIFYHTKQLGGGDAKLAMGLGAAFATSPFYISTGIPFLIILFGYIMVIGAIYGVIWAIYLITKDFKNFKSEVKKLTKTRYMKIFKIIALIIAGVFLAIIFFVLSYPSSKILMAAITIVTLIYPYIFMAAKAIENIHFYKTIIIENLVEGDWIAENVKKNNKIIIPKKTMITKKDLQKLKQNNIRQVVIKDGIPFVPPFLIGTVLALIFGNPF